MIGRRRLFTVVACCGLVAAVGVVAAPAAHAGGIGIPVGTVGFTPIDGEWVPVLPTPETGSLADAACDPQSGFEPFEPEFTNVQSVRGEVDIEKVGVTYRTYALDESVTSAAYVPRWTCRSMQVIGAGQLVDTSPTGGPQSTNWSYAYGTDLVHVHSSQHIEREGTDVSPVAQVTAKVGAWSGRDQYVNGAWRIVWYPAGCAQNVFSYQVVDGWVTKTSLAYKQACEQPPLPPAETVAMLFP